MLQRCIRFALLVASGKTNRSVKTSLCLPVLGLAYFCGLSTGRSYDVLTNHNDVARTGLVTQETILTPANVSGLKILFQESLDGNVYAQPLCVANQLVFKNGVQVGMRDLVVVATEHGSVYAFDATSGENYWQVSLLDQGFSPIPVTDPNARCGHIAPEESITATPVIDTIYSVGKGTTLKRFQFDFSNPNKPVLKTTPAATTSRTFAFPGFTPSISANGTANGLV